MMRMGKCQLTDEIRRVSFAALETNLYLDTHPMDREAIALLTDLGEQKSALVAEYESRFGPLTSTSVTDENYYMWVTGSWPWELED